MARSKFASPTLAVRITEQDYEKAQKSKSGSCLIADSIRRENPGLTSVAVDMATIRVTDKKAGKRYVYLTPPWAQHTLLSFDQGWPKPVEQGIVKRAVKITAITKSKPQQKSREERRAELEEKVSSGEALTVGEKSALTKLRQHPDRPTTTGPSEVHVQRSGRAIVSGGRPPKVGKAHPNLLRGTDRHFGAKLSNPGDVFNEAVEAAVAERLGKSDSATAAS